MYVPCRILFHLLFAYVVVSPAHKEDNSCIILKRYFFFFFFSLYFAIIWGRENLFVMIKKKKDKSKDQPDSQKARVAAVLKVALKHYQQRSKPKLTSMN